MVTVWDLASAHSTSATEAPRRSLCMVGPRGKGNYESGCIATATHGSAVTALPNATDLTKRIAGIEILGAMDLLVAKRVDRIEPARAPCGLEAEQDAHSPREDHGHADRLR